MVATAPELPVADLVALAELPAAGDLVALAEVPAAGDLVAVGAQLAAADLVAVGEFPLGAFAFMVAVAELPAAGDLVALVELPAAGDLVGDSPALPAVGDLVALAEILAADLVALAELPAAGDLVALAELPAAPTAGDLVALAELPAAGDLVGDSPALPAAGALVAKADNLGAATGDLVARFTDQAAALAIITYPDPIGPGATCSAAMEMVAGTTYTFDISGMGTVHWFKASVTSGTTYHVRITLNSGMGAQANVENGSSCASKSFLFTINTTTTPCDSRSAGATESWFISVTGSLFGTVNYSLVFDSGGC